MTDTIVNMHNAWSENNGDLFMYYEATGDYQWGFTDSIFNMLTPKLRAIDALNSASKAQNILGPLAPTTISGSLASTCNRGWGCSPLAAWDTYTAPGTPVMRIIWASYNFRTATPGAPHIVVSVSKASNASVGIYLDGSLIATRAANGTAATNMDVSSSIPGSFSPGSHSIIVQAFAGTFSVDSISIQ